MSATADRPAAEAPSTEVPSALTRVEGLELLGEVSGSGYKDGAALVRRADGQMVQLGPLMYALLEAIDGERDPAALAAAMTERLGRQVDEEHVLALGQKLCEQGLLVGSEDNAPERMNPLLALRWKVLFTDPKVTKRITAPFEHLFRPWLLVPLLMGFAVVFWFVLIHKGVASATAQAFNSPELLLLIFGLGVASAGFHEIGHASACRYGGGRPGGMGAGIYVVWPAFYTDVTDAYRLPRRARLRTDLGGLYFNAVVAVVTLGVWWAVRADALLLVIALQMLEMVKQLSPVIRADGYHILSDATGVPDLYAHMGPTLKRLLPWTPKEPSALTGRTRFFVTAWVLLIVPVLISMSLSAILLLPKLATTAYASGSHIISALPDQGMFGILASILRLLALTLPVIGALLMAQRLGKTVVTKGAAWSGGRPERHGALALAAVAAAALLAWAWWPSGQYQPVRATDNGTLLAAAHMVVAPASVARPQPPTAAQIAAAPVTLKPGKHLAVALIPEGGATKKHPAVFVIKGNKGEKPVVLVSDTSPDPKNAPTAQAASADGGGGATTPTATSSTPAPSSSTTTSDPVKVAAFNFALPDKPRANDSQALAVNHEDGGIKYSVAYSLVTVTGGKPVDSRNTAYAFANCNACTTVAVSFQLVLIVGQSDTIAPLNFAGALNVNCPSCITTAIADQIVLSIKSVPSDELLQRLNEELKKLDAISALGAAGTPAEVAKQVADVQKAIQKDLDDSGLATNPPKTTTTSTTPSSTTPTSTTSTTPDSTSTTSTTPDSTSTTPDSTSTTPDTTTTAPTSTTPAQTTPTTTEPAPTSTTSTTTTP